MATLDWTEQAPGWYHVEIFAAAEMDSKRGDSMFKVDLRIASGEGAGDFLTRDYFMLTGKGGRMGAQKLAAFGFALGRGDSIEAGAIRGARAFACVAEETFNGQISLKVDGKSGTHSGYRTEDNPPDGGAVPAPAPSVAAKDIDRGEEYNFDDIPS